MPTIPRDKSKPSKDPYLAANYSAKNLHQRSWNKRKLENEFGLEKSEGPIFSVISRLSWQKGLDILFESLDEIINNGGRVAMVGQGDAFLENMFRSSTNRHPGKFAVKFEYSEEMSHLLQAGSDAIIVPSRFEPCGLTQLFAMRYGCVPMVASVGGLADSVIDSNYAAVEAGVSTGFLFLPGDRQSLLSAIHKAIDLYNEPKHWKRIQLNGMKTDVSWETSASKYEIAYKKLLSEND